MGLKKQYNGKHNQRAVGESELMQWLKINLIRRKNMKSKKMEKMYPKYWEIIESQVMDDMNNTFDVQNNDSSKFLKQRQRIAYNAAFFATHEHHKIYEQDKVKK